MDVTDYYSSPALSPKEAKLVQEGEKAAQQKCRACWDVVMNNLDQCTEIAALLDDKRIDEARALYGELSEAEQKALHLAYTKGGFFTTEQRARLKGL